MVMMKFTPCNFLEKYETFDWKYRHVNFPASLLPNTHMATCIGQNKSHKYHFKYNSCCTDAGV